MRIESRFGALWAKSNYSSFEEHETPSRRGQIGWREVFRFEGSQPMSLLGYILSLPLVRTFFDLLRFFDFDGCYGNSKYNDAVDFPVVASGTVQK
jgi:hypothetical protein